MLFSYNPSHALEKSSFPNFYSHTIAAGFPSPADDYCESSLDLNEFLIHHPSSTLFVTAPDNSMSQYGLFKGDLLIVDKSLKVREGNVVLIHYQGEQIVRKVFSKHGKVTINASPKEQLDSFHENAGDLEIIGVVKTVIHRFKV